MESKNDLNKCVETSVINQTYKMGRALMNKKIIDSLLIVICIVLIFNNIPKPIQLNFIGSNFGSRLILYPLIAAILYTIYYKYKNNIKMYNEDALIKYSCVFLGVNLLSVALGLYFYPYYDLVFSGPIEQIEKLPKVIDFLNEVGFYVDQTVLLQLWIIARMMKGVVLELLWGFGGAYIVYFWYHDNWKYALKILTKAILFSFIIITAYSFIELFYLNDNSIAAAILSTINPYIHSIKNNGTWYPPLLWKGQLRSVFAEPSYFGIYSAFAIPFLWYGMISSNKKFNIYIPVTIIMTFFLFLTKARTGFVIHVGELAILAFFLVYIRQKEFFKKACLVFLCSILAFVGSNLFIAHFVNKKENATAQENSLDIIMEQYIDSNAKSLANPDQRSNRARYSVMEADFRIGLDHPLLGVGSGLRNAYIPDYFSGEAKKNGEVNMWLSFQKKLGVMRFWFPKLGEYTSRFAETGILGLGVFLFPPLFLIWHLLKRIKNTTDNEQYQFIMFFVSLAGIMASGIGDSLNITYCYWILLGLGYAMCFGKKGQDLTNE